jgi:hypothetical protein
MPFSIMPFASSATNAQRNVSGTFAHICLNISKTAFFHIVLSKHASLRQTFGELSWRRAQDSMWLRLQMPLSLVRW